MKKPPFKILVILFVVSIVVCLLTPFAGLKWLTLTDVLNADLSNREFSVFWKMRLPRTIMAFMAGAMFALGGMVFQAVFRNPLVSPFTLGVSAGASFGAAIYIALGFSFSILGLSGISLFAFLGATLSIGIVWHLAYIRNRFSTSVMLLAGIAASFIFGSLIMFIQYLSGVIQAVRISRWLMGGLDVFGYQDVLNVLPIAVIGFCFILYFTNELNLLTIGEDLATARGVQTKNTIIILFFLISLMIGGVVSVCGPIAFVGIVAPHVARILVGPNHRYLTPATFLFGGTLLTLCDTVARTMVAPAEIPVGVITAIIGGPFFLWLLKTKYV